MKPKPKRGRPARPASEADRAIAKELVHAYLAAVKGTDDPEPEDGVAALLPALCRVRQAGDDLAAALTTFASYGTLVSIPPKMRTAMRNGRIKARYEIARDKKRDDLTDYLLALAEHEGVSADTAKNAIWPRRQQP